MGWFGLLRVSGGCCGACGPEKLSNLLWAAQQVNYGTRPGPHVFPRHPTEGKVLTSSLEASCPQKKEASEG